MGYCIHQGQSQFFVPRERLADLLAALNSFARTAHQHRLSWVRPETLVGANSIDEHLREWRWHPHYSAEGLIGLSFEGEKYGSDKLLFDTIAPFVRAGSFVVMHGEDGATWRWYFDGAKCHEQDAALSFGPAPGDIVDVDARVVEPAKSLPAPRKQLR